MRTNEFVMELRMTTYRDKKELLELVKEMFEEEEDMEVEHLFCYQNGFDGLKNTETSKEEKTNE